MVTGAMPPESPSLSLFIPFYDELEALPEVVAQALEVLGGWGGEHEIVLVDDGSSDGSERLALELAERHEVVRVVRHESNQGYGAALCTGFAACTGAVVCYSDADLPVDLQRFVEVLPLLEEADLVVGYPRDWVKTPRRQLYTAAYRALVRLLLGVRVRDVNFSFKLLRRELLERMELDARTGLIDAQLLAEAGRLGARRTEVEVAYQERRHGNSHFDHPSKALETGVELLRWWWRSRR